MWDDPLHRHHHYAKHVLHVSLLCLTWQQTQWNNIYCDQFQFHTSQLFSVNVRHVELWNVRSLRCKVDGLRRRIQQMSATVDHFDLVDHVYLRNYSPIRPDWDWASVMSFAPWQPHFLQVSHHRPPFISLSVEVHLSALGIRFSGILSTWPNHHVRCILITKDMLLHPVFSYRFSLEILLGH